MSVLNTFRQGCVLHRNIFNAKHPAFTVFRLNSHVSPFHSSARKGVKIAKLLTVNNALTQCVSIVSVENEMFARCVSGFPYLLCRP